MHVGKADWLVVCFSKNSSLILLLKSLITKVLSCDVITDNTLNGSRFNLQQSWINLFFKKCRANICNNIIIVHCHDFINFVVTIIMYNRTLTTFAQGQIQQSVSYLSFVAYP